MESEKEATMNRLGWILVMLACTGMMLFGQETNVNEDEFEEAMQEFEEAMDEVGIELNEALEDIPITINIRDFNNDSPKMGVYLADLDFEDIYEMRYEKNYGVLLTGATNEGPAKKAGMMKGDIIMEFNGEKVKFEQHLLNLIKSHQIGDEIDIKFFRMGKVYETKLVLDTLSKKRMDKNIIITKTGEKKRRLSVGHGGGSWYPIWFMPDLTDFNGFLAEMDFGEETFSEDGFLIHGGGGMGNVGKGWFIGGMGAGYERKETSKYDWEHYKEGALVTTSVSREVKYDIGFGGVTLDKRFALSRKLITSVGFMLGWGENSYEITQIDNNGDISNFDFENPNLDFDGNYDFRSKVEIKTDYILFQPKVTMMWRILDWLAFRTEVGYMASYSSKGWEAEHNGESVKLLNAPDASIDGLTFSIGPWFGF
jgi:PDZ domain